MSNFLLPSPIGLAWPVTRAVNYKTLVDEGLSRRVATLAIQQYATYQWSLDYTVLFDNITPSDIKALVGLFGVCRGRFDSFLYLDPVFNTATNEPFGIGDGVTTAFQIVATFKNPTGPGRADIIQNFVAIPSIFDNGVQTFSFSLGPSGIATFFSPPALGHTLTWSGEFYQRCHFLQDTLKVQQFMNQWWKTTQLQFRSVLL